MELLWEFHAGAADPLEADQTTLRSLFPGDSSAQFAKVVRSYVFADAQPQLEQALAQFPAPAGTVYCRWTVLRNQKPDCLLR
jgi:hypothetical protein